MTAALLALMVAAAPAPGSYDPAALATLDAMAAAAAGVNDYTMTLVKRELRGRDLEPEETIQIKWMRPQHIYLKSVAGLREGQEVLYATGWNKDRLKVHKGSFPDFKVNLDPYGNTAMAHSHHPLPDVSLPRLVTRIMDNVKRARDKGVGAIAVAGHETLWGAPVTKLELTMPPTGKTPTLAKGQTLWDIAKETGQSMYVILHANRARGWRQADHPEPGDAVIVPDFYAGRLVLWIDDRTHLPLQTDIYDHEGALYEHYEHRDLRVNVGLTPADFDPKNPAYKF